ncbi:recombinase family protein [Vallitalea maricola]|uniref:Recombinase family protein n=1 Tax=Vallitalea maricola TaxID=3074433 RepID=A0ACB5UHF0_9FIRM|nr:recombinase family protein [Vallitalea sp. AN17-2]
MYHNIKGLRTIALYRVSTNKQDEAMQRKSCRDFCENNGLKIIDEYTEIDVSGFKTPLKDRYELIKILMRAEKKEFDILLIYNNDRLTRRSDEAPHILQVLSNNEIKVFETSTDAEIKTDSHMDKLMNFFNSWTAEFESIKTSMRVKSSFADKNEEGKFLGGLPFGYRLINTNYKNKKGKYINKMIIDENEANIVRKIFDLYINKNMGTVRIANYLNENSYLTRKKKEALDHNIDIKENQYLWRASTITRILRNPVYIGQKAYNKTKSTRDKVVKNKREEYKLQPYNEELRIISNEDFYQAGFLLERRKKRKNVHVSTATISDNALCSGLIYCRCGAKLKTGYSISKYHRKKDNKDIQLKIYYYFCPNSKVNKVKHKDITNKNIFSVLRYDSIIDKIILHELRNFNNRRYQQVLNERINSNIHIKQNELNNLRLLRGKLEKLIVKYEIAIDECFINGEKDKVDIYINNINRNKAKLTKLDMEIKRLTDYNSDGDRKIKMNTRNDEFSSLGDRYSNASLNEKKAILSKIINKIVISEDEIIIDFMY